MAIGRRDLASSLVCLRGCPRVDAFDELLHADVVVRAPMGLSTNGIEAEKQVWRAIAEMPDLRHDIRDT